MKLSNYLKLHQITASEFADRIRVNRSAVCRWERGERIPGRVHMALIQLATAGQVTPNDFFDFPAVSGGAQGCGFDAGLVGSADQQDQDGAGHGANCGPMAGGMP